MKIAFIGQKGREKISELAVRLAKSAHEVFIYSDDEKGNGKIQKKERITVINYPFLYDFFSVCHALFSSYDVIHFHGGAKGHSVFFLKLFKIKTVIINLEIPQGLSLEFPEGSEYLSKWNLRKGDYIFSSGCLLREKDAHLLIEAFKNLEDKHLDREKKLVVAEKDPCDADYLNELKDMARGRENIIFADAKNEEAFSQLFSHCYFFVQPSAAADLSVLGSMGRGKAVLASDIWENREFLGEGTAAYFRSGEVADLESKIVNLINDPFLIKIMGEKGLERARREFSWERISKDIEEIYKDAFAQKKKLRFNSQINAKNI